MLFNPSMLYNPIVHTGSEAFLELNKLVVDMLIASVLRYPHSTALPCTKSGEEGTFSTCTGES